LAQLARGGDRAAFAALVARYQRRLCHYLNGLVGDQEVARDLTQEAFMRAYRAIGATDAQLHFRAWLFRIASNLACDLIRRRSVVSYRPLAEAEGLEAKAVEAPIEERELVERVLRRLHPDERAVLLLCGAEGLSYAEAAVVLGIRVDAVRKRFVRAKTRFRSLYDEQGSAGAA
jgi:RNA polymerase sigma-70 factor (ECF subfamily)